MKKNQSGLFRCEQCGLSVPSSNDLAMWEVNRGGGLCNECFQIFKITRMPSNEKQSLTIEIEKQLLLYVKKVAKEQNVTLRQIVEYGLKSYINELANQKKNG